MHVRVRYLGIALLCKAFFCNPKHQNLYFTYSALICCCLSAARAADSTPDQKQLLSTLQREVKSVNDLLQKDAEIHQTIRDDLSQVSRYDDNMCIDSILLYCGYWLAFLCTWFRLTPCTTLFTQAMREFKPHERVNEFIFTVEPFSMSNGQLTQTLKVKRHKVLSDYAY